jgi:hypothetical protein
MSWRHSPASRGHSPSIPNGPEPETGKARAGPGPPAHPQPLRRVKFSRQDVARTFPSDSPVTGTLKSHAPQSPGALNPETPIPHPIPKRSIPGDRGPRAPGRMLDTLLPFPDAEYPAFYPIGIKASCVCMRHPAGPRPPAHLRPPRRRRGGGRRAGAARAVPLSPVSCHGPLSLFHLGTVPCHCLLSPVPWAPGCPLPPVYSPLPVRVYSPQSPISVP